MNELPGELVNCFCSYLSQPSLKAFRLTCKVFASIGEEHLFRDFEFRLLPNHRRLYQLEQLAGQSSIAKRLKVLSFESGVQLEYADYRYWQANTYQDISSAWSQGLSSRGGSHELYGEFHGALQARFTPDMPTRYELLRWHLDQEAKMVAEPRVRNVLMRILNALSEHVLDLKFKIIMTEPRITLHELETFDSSQYACGSPIDPDPRRRVLNRRSNCLKHFLNFLDAANLSDIQASRFSAIDMPDQLLTVDSIHGSETLNEYFRNLRNLDLKISHFPISDWLSRVGGHEIYFGGRNLAAKKLVKLLNLPANPERLRLEFPEGKEAEYSFDLFDRTNIDRFPRLWLPHLKSLSLCRFRCTWQDLKAFLGEAKNVRALTLSYCRFETGSMLDLINFLPCMKLDSVCLEGKWYVDEDTGEWHSHTAADFTDCFAATSYEGPYISNGMRSKIHRYMLTGGDCPLPTWTTGGKEEEIWEMTGDTSWHYLPGLARN